METISEGAYISTESLREDYKRAMAQTTFKTDVTKLSARQAASERIMAKILASEPLDDKDREDIKTFGIKQGRQADT